MHTDVVVEKRKALGGRPFIPHSTMTAKTFNLGRGEKRRRRNVEEVKADDPGKKKLSIKNPILINIRTRKIKLLITSPLLITLRANF